MAYALQLTIISRQDNKPARITSMNLTDEVSQQCRAVLEAFESDGVVQGVTTIVENEDDGIALPLRAFGRMDRDDILQTINGVEVNGSTFAYIERAAQEIEAKIVAGNQVELFLQAA